MKGRPRMAIELMSEHLSRADSELEATQQFLNLRTHDEAELDLVRAVANARVLVGEALERARRILEDVRGAQ